MCASTQTTCALLEDYKFLEPLRLQRDKHERNRKKLKERWKWERKKLQEVVLQLNKAQGAYYQRHQEYERCREALRIAEQGAEIGATGENKVEKRKRLEEDALQKTAECETHYRSCVDEANERHRHIQLVKTDILREVREMTIGKSSCCLNLPRNMNNIDELLDSPQLERLISLVNINSPCNQRR